MKHGPLSTSRVVAGSQKLNNVVKDITIIEAPDIIDWLSGGELLLTNLYSMVKESINYKVFVQTIVDKNVSALAIKVQRFVPTVPSEILEAAEEFGLPVIELDTNIKFVDVMYPVMGELFNSQVNELNYYKNVQERFTTLALSGRGIEDIINTLENLVENPVGVFDHSFKCIGVSNSFIGIHFHLSSLNECDVVNEPFTYYRKRSPFGVRKEEVNQIIVEIEALNQLKVYLMIIEANRELQKFDFIGIENAATVIRLELVKQFSVLQVEQRFRNDLVNDIVSGCIENKIAKERAGLLGWNLESDHIVVVFKISNAIAHFERYNNQHLDVAYQGVKSEITSLISNYIRFYTNKSIIGGKGDSIVLFWPIKSKDDSQDSKIKSITKEIQNEIRKKYKYLSISIGIGSIASEIEQLIKSYEEAYDAILYGEMIYGQDVIMSYSELGIFRLLSEVGSEKNLDRFIPESLKKLKKLDKENQTDFVKTLEVLFECNGNASKASKRLFIHYKTILYRIEKIKELTKLDLEDTNSRLELEIGLKLLKMYRQG